MQSEIPEDFSIVVQPPRGSISESHCGSNVDSEDALLSHHDTSGTSGETCRFQNMDGDVKIVKGIPVKKRWQKCESFCWIVMIVALIAAVLGLFLVAYKLYAPLQNLWRNESMSTKDYTTNMLVPINFKEPVEPTMLPKENERFTGLRKPRRNFSEPITSTVFHTLPQTTEWTTSVISEIPPTEMASDPSTLTSIFNAQIPTDVISENEPIIESPMPTTQPPKTYGSKAFIEAPGRSFVNSPIGANYMLATIGEIGTQLTSVEVSYKYFNADKTSPLDYLADVTDAVNRSSAFQMKNMLIAHNTTIASPPQKYKNTTLHFVEPVSFAMLQSEIQEEYGFLGEGNVITQEMFPTTDSLIAVNFVDFEMEFKQTFAGLWYDRPNFKGLDGGREVTKVLGILQGTKMYSDNYDIYTWPMARDGYHFFVMEMRDDVTEDTVPTSDNYASLLNSAIDTDHQEITIAMPVFEHKTLTNYTQWAQKYQLTASIPLGNEDRAHSKYLKVAAAYQATRFTLNHKGVNVVSKDMIVEETTNIETELVDIDRPFYYGIFYKSGSDQAIVYFGAYF
uniref:SERPIN domain-containing protein n=1 Tax=Panagrellus redivivus TaxID=6233 RepID=A0A7E4ZWB2_PANRE